MKKLFIAASLMFLFICGIGVGVLGLSNILEPQNELNKNVSYFIYIGELCGGVMLMSLPILYFLKDTIRYGFKHTGINLIAKERREQIKKHNRSVALDIIQNPKGELLFGAQALMEDDYGCFPSQWDSVICANMLAKSEIERLAIAGAFIAAEIDRLQAKK